MGKLRLMKFELSEILPRIYLLRFGSAYDLAMHFLRAQEYAESPKYYHQVFTLVDYMEWYSRTKGKGAFTYPADWSGFNVPGDVLLALYHRKPSVIPDPNKYDEFMSVVVSYLVNDSAGKDFYLIGTSLEGFRGDGRENEVLDHELAHGFYFTDPSYREAVQNLLTKMDKEKRLEIKRTLEEMGYHTSVVNDETQAYCATGPCKPLEGILNEEMQIPFRKTFKKFSQKHFSTRVKERMK